MSKVNTKEFPKKKTEIEKIVSKRVVFIIDECHRSTFGDMLIDIKRTFPHAVFFGLRVLQSMRKIKEIEYHANDLWGKIAYVFHC